VIETVTFEGVTVVTLDPGARNDYWGTATSQTASLSLEEMRIEIKETALHNALK
jgi:hypothetical protein